ncbi:NAD-dependent epimerase/dehydratase family protein [Microbacterium sp. PRC9]|uniref:NAD-dependent epimerase/dehydratase family protein n=1 Tax=Microbacterium sp. PRC9 TaxID=2962591 RepID=UPI0028810A7D|nr:NAD-dependent epimerase/dehydratase family protein [Microbacterium sp. PRC9]MDT0141481.1 NAD-dependent epimerase/dehydratase family protein [Microbacterium sp. PRC9]
MIRRPAVSLGPRPELRWSADRPGFRPRRVVVVGGSGFVGAALVAGLVSIGTSTQALGAPRLRLDPSISNPSRIVDAARDCSAVERLTDQLRGADVVVNAAGLAAPDSPATGALYGANALLPAVLALAAKRAGVARVIHVSSAAVQGRRRVLDESLDVAPFSPYSHAKALGERGFLMAGQSEDYGIDFVVIRATSVQGEGRATTQALRRIARSPLASVASPGSQPTTVSSINALTHLIMQIVACEESIPPVVLQPWEGYGVREILTLAGASAPVQLPRSLATAVLSVARLLGNLSPQVAGVSRRVELMWMGQEQASGFATRFRPVEGRPLASILTGRVS